MPAYQSAKNPRRDQLAFTETGGWVCRKRADRPESASARNFISIFSASFFLKDSHCGNFLSDFHVLRQRIAQSVRNLFVRSFNSPRIGQVEGRRIIHPRCLALIIRSIKKKGIYGYSENSRGA